MGDRYSVSANCYNLKPPVNDHKWNCLNHGFNLSSPKCPEVTLPKSINWKTKIERNISPVMCLVPQHTLPAAILASSFLSMEGFLWYIISLMVSAGSFFEESVYIKPLKVFIGISRRLSAFSVDPLCYVHNHFSAVM